MPLQSNHDTITCTFTRMNIFRIRFCVLSTIYPNSIINRKKRQWKQKSNSKAVDITRQENYLYCCITWYPSTGSPSAGSVPFAGWFSADPGSSNTGTVKQSKSIKLWHYDMLQISPLGLLEKKAMLMSYIIPHFYSFLFLQFTAPAVDVGLSSWCSVTSVKGLRVSVADS